VLGVLLVVSVSQVSASESLLSLPVLFSGQVSVDGDPSPDGLVIFARILDWESQRVTVKDSRYAALPIAPPRVEHVNKPIFFFATYGFDEVQANNSATYRRPSLSFPSTLTVTQDLVFSRLPEMPPPTPTPTPRPTPTMTPTPTPALPIPGDPSVRGLWMWVVIVGVVAVLGGVTVWRLAVKQ